MRSNSVRACCTLNFIGFTEMYDRRYDVKLKQMFVRSIRGVRQSDG